MSIVDSLLFRGVFVNTWTYDKIERIGVKNTHRKPQIFRIYIFNDLTTSVSLNFPLAKTIQVRKILTSLRYVFVSVAS